MKQIPGFDKYLIAENGKVFSNQNWRGYGVRELKQTPNDDGYPSVRLSCNGKRKHLAVHRLMAMTFLPPRPSEQHEIRHLDGDKTNNYVSNLAWGTPKENAEDRERHGRTFRGRKTSTLTEQQVKEIKNLLQSGLTHKQIAEKYRVHRSTISYINTGRCWVNVS